MKLLGPPQHRNSHGFTLIEVLVVLVIILTLLGLTLVNYNQPIKTASLGTTTDTLVADLRAQQLLAMSGGTDGTASAVAYGIFIQNNQYVLFSGSAYSAGASTNFTVSMPSTVTLTTTLPSTQVVFIKGTGEVQGFVNGSNTITLTASGTTHLITINRFGVTAVT